MAAQAAAHTNIHPFNTPLVKSEKKNWSQKQNREHRRNGIINLFNLCKTIFRANTKWSGIRRGAVYECVSWYSQSWLLISIIAKSAQRKPNYNNNLPTCRHIRHRWRWNQESCFCGWWYCCCVVRELLAIKVVFWPVSKWLSNIKAMLPLELNANLWPQLVQ